MENSKKGIYTVEGRLAQNKLDRSRSHSKLLLPMTPKCNECGQYLIQPLYALVLEHRRLMNLKFDSVAEPDLENLKAVGETMERIFDKLNFNCEDNCGRKVLSLEAYLMADYFPD